jgi:outer membrane lipoprotein SlyB
VEKNVKSTTRYTIKVKMDDGEMRTFHREKRPRLSEGQRVRVDGDKLRPL